uniref:Trehalose 6-phosphate phosphatase n=1 Tax=Angiostrongylus cantonensis TaxID=6313 RepID=A0A0K0D7K0_ANGCA
MKNLVLENSSPLEIEVCAHSSGAVWNKGDGVASLIASLHDSLKNGKVLVAGDTTSDLPMLQHVVSENPDGVMALFVGASESLRQSVGSIVGDDSRVCFVSCPDVIHAAFSRVLAAKIELD